MNAVTTETFPPLLPLPRPSLDRIVDAVCAQLGVTRADLLGRERLAHSIEARRIAWWIHSRCLRASSVEIGRRYNVDHTTVLYALRRIEPRLESDDGLRGHVRAIMHTLGLDR